ncbi:MAG TPA: PEGA domain-containing protein [Nitrospirota bacterium]|nr:PEGA domain-containing protein [Nitrospirota bacterium]
MKNIFGGVLFCFILLAGCATTSTITVKTDPAGAHIYLDGKSMGQTPATIKVKFSENAQLVTEKKILAVQLPGYRERKEVISLEGTPQMTLEFLLVPELKKSTTQVVSKTTATTTAQLSQETKSVRH